MIVARAFASVAMALICTSVADAEAVAPLVAQQKSSVDVDAGSRLWASYCSSFQHTGHE